MLVVINNNHRRS